MSSIKLLLWSKIFSETNDSDKTVMLMTEGTPDAAHLTEAQAALRVPKLTLGTPVYAVPSTATFTGTTISNSRVVQIATAQDPFGSYEFVTSLTGRTFPPWGVLIGATDSDSLDNLIAAINGDAGAGTLYDTLTPAHSIVTAAAGSGDTMVITSVIAGTSSNEYEVATSGPGDCAWGAATMTGGSDCTTAIEGDHYKDDDYLYTAVQDLGVGATTGWAASAITMLEDIV